MKFSEKLFYQNLHHVISTGISTDLEVVTLLITSVKALSMQALPGKLIETSFA